MTSDSMIKQKALAALTTYLGDSTARLYRQFYADKSDDVILISVRELLTEYIGDEKAQICVQEIQSNQ